IWTAEWLEPLYPRKFFRNDGDHLNVGIVFLEAFANACDGTARTDPADKMGEFPLRLLQNLYRRAVIVRLPVTGIAVLIGEEIALRLTLGQAMDLVQRFVIAFERICSDELGTMCHNALASFETGIFRHHQVYRVL